MDLQRLKYFMVIVEQGSISKAALVLNMSQPPLSIAIKKLEEELGISLFERHGKRLHLTKSGELLYKRAKDLIVRVGAIKKEIQDYNEGISGVVNVGSSTMANITIIPKVVEKLLEQNLNITINLKAGTTSYVLNELRNNKVDVGIVRNVFSVNDLEINTLLNEPLMLALPPNHPLINKKVIMLEDLKGENFLMQSTTFGYGISDSIIEACQVKGFNPNVIYWATETLPMLYMVNKGLGVAFAPKSFMYFDSNDIPPLREFDSPELSTKLSIITIKNRYKSAAVNKFLEVTKEVIESYSFENY